MHAIFILVVNISRLSFTAGSGVGLQLQKAPREPAEKWLRNKQELGPVRQKGIHHSSDEAGRGAAETSGARDPLEVGILMLGYCKELGGPDCPSVPLPNPAGSGSGGGEQLASEGLRAKWSYPSSSLRAGPAEERSAANRGPPFVLSSSPPPAEGEPPLGKWQVYSGRTSVSLFFIQY